MLIPVFLVLSSILSRILALDDSLFIDQVLPSTRMVAEERNRMFVTMKNTGTESWTSLENYCLDAQNVTENWRWGISHFLTRGRICLGTEDVIDPGEVMTFDFGFDIRAPESPGVYNWQWQMVKSGIVFGESTPPIAITVVEPYVTVKSLTLLDVNGGRVDWSSRSGNDLIVYDRLIKEEYDDLSPDGCYDIWTMNPDGTNRVCLSCNWGGFGNRHVGQPAWHPSGDYIVFQAENDIGNACHPVSSPGIGYVNELFIMSNAGNEIWRLTFITDISQIGRGVLHPHFNWDGTQLSWTEMYRLGNGGWGFWKIMIADFVVHPEDGPRLVNHVEYIPGAEGFFENHGFSPDGKTIIFSTDVKIEEEGLASGQAKNIYTLNLETNTSHPCTDDEGYHNEHSLFSPTGKKISYMSGMDNLNGGTDLWLMNPDGSAKWRMTNFNRPGYPEYVGDLEPEMTVADNSWNREGTKIVFFAQTSIVTQIGGVWLLELEGIEPYVDPIEEPEPNRAWAIALGSVLGVLAVIVVLLVIAGVCVGAFVAGREKTGHSGKGTPLEDD